MLTPRNHCLIGVLVLLIALFLLLLVLSLLFLFSFLSLLKCQKLLVLQHQILLRIIEKLNISLHAGHG